MVDGQQIPSGSSVYHTTHNRVLWIDEIIDDIVVLRTVDRRIKVTIEAFRTNIADGTLKVESAPPPRE